MQMSDIIKVDDLTMVLKSRMEIESEEARALAEFVLDIFGLEDRIIDNLLYPSDRQLFYFLEGKGILSTGRETISLYDGRDWRIHYWVFNRDLVRHFLTEEEKRTKEKKEEDVYSELPPEAWVRQ
jgi:hypothetical protein